MPTEQTAVDAMNDALSDVTIGAPDANAATEDTLDSGADATGDNLDSLETGDDKDAAGDSEAADKSGEQGKEAAGEDKSEGEGDKLVRDPVTGKFVKKSDVEAAAKAAGDDKTAKPDAGKKQPDHINDPIPKDLKPQTQERMRSLVKTAKEVTGERDAVRKDFDFMIQGIQATGTTPEQYGEVLSFMALFNSGDPAQQEKALELIDGLAERLATLIGKDRSVGDPFASHPDLRDAVAKGQVTAQYAKEIARTRNQGALRTELTTQARTQSDQQTAQAQELHSARTGLNELEAQLQATDKDYEAKKAALVPVLQPIFKALPPSQWKSAFQQAYKAVRVAAPAARPNPVPKQQPMRAGRAAGGGSGTGSNGMATGASSAMDAMSAALAQMGK